MCIIVDTNVAARVLLRADDPDFHELHRALVGGKGQPARMVYGGRLNREYLKNDRLRRLLVELRRIGRASLISDAKVDAEERRVKRLQVCSSDDEHVIALARVSGARLLCSHDDALQDDFRDKRLLDHPRGRVYLRASHRKLLREMCG